MPGDHDFEVLYKDDDSHIRGNANLPGHLVYTMTAMTNLAMIMDAARKAIELAYPGHVDPDALNPRPIPEGVRAWSWLDFGIPEDFNPVRDLLNPYLQISRAEAMKGSEQTTRGFGGRRATEMEGVGVEPNLTPKERAPQGGVMVVVQNGARDAKKSMTDLKERFKGMDRG